MGKLNAGDLSERVTLLTSGPGASDGRGGFVEDGPDTETSVWAHVRALSGRELLALGQTNNASAYEVTLRLLPGVTPAQRLRWGGKVYNVQRVVRDTGNEFALLTCFDSGK